MMPMIFGGIMQHIKEVASGDGEQFTTLDVAPSQAQQPPNEPVEFYSMPSGGQTLQGLRRGVLYGLARDRLIETISVRRKGKSRGRRLIVAESLKKYLRRLRAEQNANANAKESAE
jgi:hypothetical protein